MHIGFRYHVASLVAVFFSLVLGMLIGSALFQDDGLVQEQGYMINDLENRFKALEIRTKTLQENLDFAMEKEAVITAAWDQLNTFFISNRLKDQDIVLYANEDLPNLERLSTLLIASGAKFHGQFDFPSEIDQDELAKLDISGKHQPIAMIYANQNQLNWSNIEHLQSEGWQVCIIQPFESTINLKEFSEGNLVIDGIDTPIGELALIQGLAQSLTGRFGWGKEFTSLLPALDVE